MMGQNFNGQLKKAWSKNNSLLCVGLDPELEKIPKGLGVVEFLKSIVACTAQYACSFKPQIAHFSALGMEAELKELCAWIKKNYPGHILILDAKRGDISTTAQKYALEAFHQYQADAVTLNPYLGIDSLEAFTKFVDKGSIVLVRTSNPGAKDFQNLICDGEPLYIHVAKKLRDSNENKNICFVVGATYPEEMKKLRNLCPEIPFLVPGIGAQGGDLKAVLQAGLDQNKEGLLINSSRSILYASSQKENFELAAAEEAKKLNSQIQAFR